MLADQTAVARAAHLVEPLDVNLGKHLADGLADPMAACLVEHLVGPKAGQLVVRWAFAMAARKVAQKDVHLVD